MDIFFLSLGVVKLAYEPREHVVRQLGNVALLRMFLTISTMFVMVKYSCARELLVITLSIMVSLFVSGVTAGFLSYNCIRDMGPVGPIGSEVPRSRSWNPRMGRDRLELVGLIAAIFSLALGVMDALIVSMVINLNTAEINVCQHVYKPIVVYLIVYWVWIFVACLFTCVKVSPICESCRADNEQFPARSSSTTELEIVA